MKRSIIVTLLLGTTGLLQAQVQLNPQVGVTFQDLTEPAQQSTFRSAIGYQLGADLRFGDRMFFQAGAFLGRNRTIVSSVNESNTQQTVFEDDLIRTNLKLRALAGFRLIDTYQFDLRFAAGPSYDIQLSVDTHDEPIEWNEGDFNNGSFNIDAALGLDIGLITLEPSVSFGLSRAFNDIPDQIGFNSKYLTYGFTVGVNFGSDD